MPSICWGRPVIVRKGARIKTVTNTLEAASCLMRDWPGDEGNAFDDALTICLAVIAGKGVDRGFARSAFVIAAKEEGIYLR